MPSETEPQIISDEFDWRDLEDVLAEIADLAKGTVHFEDLAFELLRRAVQLLAAVGGGVWLRNERGSLRLVCQVNLGALSDSEAFHRPLLQEVLSKGELHVFDPHTPPVGRSLVPTDHVFVLGPLKSDRDVVGVIEIIQRPAITPSALRGNRRFLALVCELASDCLLRQELRRLRDGESSASRLTTFAHDLHESLDRQATAYMLANAGRQLIGCDRLSVALRRGRTYRLLAISGIDTIEHRSDTVHRLAQLAATVGRTGQPFWYDGDDRELPPEIVEPLHSYLDRAHARTFGILPLAPPANVSETSRRSDFGALIIEQFDAKLDDLARVTATSVTEHGGLALFNTLRYESLLTIPFLRHRKLNPDGSLFGVRSVLAGAAIVGAILALILVPADFTVYADGQLQPQNRQNIFAPMDGQVKDLAVEHGDVVAAGDTLAMLDSPALDLEIQAAQGAYDTTRKRLLAVEATLLQSGTAAQRTADRADEFASEREELIQLLDSHSEQLHLLREQRQALTLNSPIAGQVITWDLDQLLRNRPVQRGQTLMTVADLSGPWIADLEVPDNQIGYVVNAQDAMREPLEVSFQLATDRSVSYGGKVRSVASRTDINLLGRPIATVSVQFDESGIAKLRPGATIFAKINCGRRSLGFVWFHQLIETLRGWALF